MGVEDRPCKDNVKVGDFLVSDYLNNTSILLKINKIYDEGIYADGIMFAAQYRSFKDSVILKQDGSYLVGENTIEELDGSPSFLVAEYQYTKSVLFKILKMDENVFAERKIMSKCRRYEDGVILKSDGTYLVGEKVIKSD